TDYTPQVTPDAGTQEVPLASTGHIDFAVKNNGTRSAQYQISTTCAPGCLVTPTTLTVNPGITATARVTFSTPLSAAATTAVSAVARYQDQWGVAIADT